MTSSVLKNFLSPNLGYLLGLAGIIYSARSAKTNELRKIRYDSFLQFGAGVYAGGRLAETKHMIQDAYYELEPDREKHLEDLRLSFNSWIDVADSNLNQFLLTAPNFVANQGIIFKGYVHQYYEGKSLFRHWQYESFRFQRYARFDLRHFFWSYLWSIFYLLIKALHTLRNSIFEFFPFLESYQDWFHSLSLVKHFQNSRNARFELKLFREWPLTANEKAKFEEFVDHYVALSLIRPLKPTKSQKLKLLVFNLEKRIARK